MLKIRGETIVLPVWRHDVMLSKRMSILNLHTFLITIFIFRGSRDAGEATILGSCAMLPAAFLYSALSEVVRCLGVFV
jgi:hypothetical protein